MHDTALSSGSLFFNKYDIKGKVLDVGSFDVNGSLRSVAPTGVEYIGLDIAEGKGVDVFYDGQHFPFDENSFDAIVSTSCFEHDPTFWMTFLEMVRVVKPGGFIYINAPSTGFYHAYPMDCWRFKNDAGKGLSIWAKRSGYNVSLIESDVTNDDVWHDCVMIFKKESNVD